MITVFNRARIARQRARIINQGTSADFLAQWAMDQIEDRLDIVRRNFPVCVQIGTRAPVITKEKFGIETLVTTDLTPLAPASVICDEEFLPFANQSIDLVVSALDLHTVNDLPGTLLQIRRALKPDGLFLSAMLGGETLYELRQCLLEAELEITGGTSPRVAPFADKPQMGGLLQRAEFALPVVDSEIVTVTYDSIFGLMKDLRHMGEGNAIAARIKHFTPRGIFMRAGELYAEKFSDPDGRIRATFEIIFLLGWSPHNSQQQPLKPGSATARLADVLGTQEISTGEKP